MIEIVWFIPVIYFTLIIGIGIALSSCIMHDKRKDKRLRKMLNESDSWCRENCKKWDECFSYFEDPDDALKELESYCMNCPMTKAVEIICKEEKKVKK